MSDTHDFKFEAPDGKMRKADDGGVNGGVNIEVFIKQTTCRKFRHMGATGQEYETKYYNLDAIISVYRRWSHVFGFFVSEACFCEMCVI